MASRPSLIKRIVNKIAHHAGKPVVIHGGRPRLKEWRPALGELIAAINDKNLSVLAAGVAYFSTLAFFPMLVVLVSLTAFFIQPDQIDPIIKNVNHYLPGDIAGLVSAQLQNLSGQHATTLLASLLAIAIALYGISGAFDNIIKAMNVAFGLKETRSFFQTKGLSVLLSLGAIAFLLIAVPLMGVTATMLTDLGLPELVATFIVVLRWPLLLLLVLTALALLYHFGPNHGNRWQWHWLSWGSIIASVLWMLATTLFFVYVHYFGHFSNSYSLFAGIIVLMIWFNLSAMIFLIGADINGRITRHAKR